MITKNKTQINFDEVGILYCSISQSQIQYTKFKLKNGVSLEYSFQKKTIWRGCRYRRYYQCFRQAIKDYNDLSPNNKIPIKAIILCNHLYLLLYIGFADFAFDWYNFGNSSKKKALPFTFFILALSLFSNWFEKNKGNKLL